jgi:hypothetical protein
MTTTMGGSPSGGVSVPAEGVTTTVSVYHAVLMKIPLTICSEPTGVNKHPFFGDPFISGPFNPNE